jgi:hypothetical protein
MPLLLAPLFAALLGVVLAWVARLGLRRHSGPVLTSRPLAVVAIFCACVELPCFAHVALLHGDWGYLYIAPSSSIPSAIDVLLVLFAAGATPCAFMLASRAAMGARFDLLFRALIGLVGALFLAALLAFRRIFSLSTYAQFQGDFGPKTLASGGASGVGIAATGGSLVLSWLALGAGLFICIRNLRDAGDEQ